LVQPPTRLYYNLKEEYNTEVQNPNILFLKTRKD